MHDAQHAERRDGREHFVKEPVPLPKQTNACVGRQSGGRERASDGWREGEISILPVILCFGSGLLFEI